MEKILDVGYLSQRDNDHSPSYTCNVTTVAMCLEYRGIYSPNEDQQTEDWLYEQLKGPWLAGANEEIKRVRGYTTDKPQQFAEALAWIFRQFPETFGAGEVMYLSLSQMMRMIEEDVPLILSGRFPKKSGGSIAHFVLMIGYQDGGREIVLHDPWGNTGVYDDKDGEGIVVPWSRLDSWLSRDERNQKLKKCIVGMPR